MASLCEPILQRGGQLCVAKDLSPFREAEVGYDVHAGALVELAQQVAEKRAASRAERQTTEPVQDDQVELGTQKITQTSQLVR